MRHLAYILFLLVVFSKAEAEEQVLVDPVLIHAVNDRRPVIENGQIHSSDSKLQALLNVISDDYKSRISGHQLLNYYVCMDDKRSAKRPDYVLSFKSKDALPAMCSIYVEQEPKSETVASITVSWISDNNAHFSTSIVKWSGTTWVLSKSESSSAEIPIGRLSP